MMLAFITVIMISQFFDRVNIADCKANRKADREDGFWPVHICCEIVETGEKAAHVGFAGVHQSIPSFQCSHFVIRY